MAAEVVIYERGLYVRTETLAGRQLFRFGVVFEAGEIDHDAVLVAENPRVMAWRNRPPWVKKKGLFYYYIE
jgi:hypothetical protein